jgi:CubicO group peptidase (beta-lactamase class C family)
MNLKKHILIILIFSLTSCKVSRFIIYNIADIKDYKKFPKREIQNKSNTIFKFSKFNKNTDLNTIKNDFDKYLEDNKTVAFLVIHNDTIKYEKYYHNYNENSIVPSFSIAKSITSMLIGCAIDDKLINSINDSIIKYIPELKGKGFEKVTIEHLLQMTSGLNFSENYFNPFSEAASFYYGRNLKKEISKLQLKNEPEKIFQYVSGNTQLLGLILDRALKEKTISKYLEQKIWTPLQMEYNASWSIDRKKNGLEKTFCCVNARAKDFAKLGRLYLNKGNWNGNQIISKKWVENSIKIDLNRSVGNYQYQWWIPNDKGDFMAEGILGQFIFVSPTKNLIIVRLGKKKSKINWVEMFEKIKEKY